MLENCKIENKCLITSLIITLVLFLAALFVSAVIDIKDKMQTSENTITVFDTGEIYAKPDLALTTFSVITEAKSVVEAMNENTKKMNAVIDFIKGEGVEDKDLKTTSFSIYPRYEWYETKTCLVPPCPAGQRVLVGYEVRQSLQVKIREMSKIGPIIQGAAETGASQVGDLQFTIDKQDELKKQAREEAIKKAKTKAKELAKQLGVKLVKITNFSESSIIPYFYGLEEALGKGGESAPAPQIETGENKIEVTVTITYAIK